KLQNERLNALEAREREMLKISEEMYARQKESAAQHDSFVELQTTLKDELYHLASEREKLAVKEKSLLEAEKHITAALEASGGDAPRPRHPQGPRGGPDASVVPSRLPPFGTPRIGIAYTGTPGTRISCCCPGISPQGSGSETGPLTNVQSPFATKMSWLKPRMNAPTVSSQFIV